MNGANVSKIKPAVRGMLGLMALTGAVALTAPPAAQAADYQVKMCGDAPDRAPGPWQARALRDFEAPAAEARPLSEGCAQGDSVRAYGGYDPGSPTTQLGPQGYTELFFTTPGDVRLGSVSLSSALYGAVNMGGNGGGVLVEAYAGSGVVFNRLAAQGEGFDQRGQRLQLDLAGANAFTLRASCRSVDVGRCDLYNPDRSAPVLGIFGATFIASDSGVPVVGSPEGGATADRIDGTEELRVGLGDTGSGVKAVIVSLGGKPMAVQDFSGECNTSRFAVCPGLRSFTAALDSTMVPNGPANIDVAVADWAGNAKTYTVKTVTVANPVPEPPPTPDTPQNPDTPTTSTSTSTTPTTPTQDVPGIVPAKDAPAGPDGLGQGASAGAACYYRAADNKFYNPDAAAGVDAPNGVGVATKSVAGLGANARGTQTVSFTTAPAARGTLTNAAGQPVAGAKLFLATRPEGQTNWSLCAAQTVITDAKGRWSAKLPGRGTNRQVLAAYWPSTSSDAAIGSAVLNLRVRSGVTLNKTPKRVRGGRALTFKGGVRGAIPQGGALALVQVKIPGAKRFRTFRQIRTGSTGRLQAKFRFARRGGQKYSFRVTIPRQSGRPYDAGYSTTRIIRVR